MTCDRVEKAVESLGTASDEHAVDGDAVDEGRTAEQSDGGRKEDLVATSLCSAVSGREEDLLAVTEAKELEEARAEVGDALSAPAAQEITLHCNLGGNLGVITEITPHCPPSVNSEIAPPQKPKASLFDDDEAAERVMVPPKKKVSLFDDDDDDERVMVPPKKKVGLFADDDDAETWVAPPKPRASSVGDKDDEDAPPLWRRGGTTSLATGSQSLFGDEEDGAVSWLGAASKSKVSLFGDDDDDDDNDNAVAAIKQELEAELRRQADIRASLQTIQS